MLETRLDGGTDGDPVPTLVDEDTVPTARRRVSMTSGSRERRSIGST
jgi:hypothetical protein